MAWSLDDVKEYEKSKNTNQLWSLEDVHSYQSPPPEKDLLEKGWDAVKSIPSKIDSGMKYLGGGAADFVRNQEKQHPWLASKITGGLNTVSGGLESFNNTEGAKKLQAAGYGMGTITGNNLLNQALLPDEYQKEKENAEARPWSMMAGAALPIIASGGAGASNLSKLPGNALFRAGEKVAEKFLPTMGKGIASKIAQGGIKAATGGALFEGVNGLAEGGINYAQGRDTDPMNILNNGISRASTGAVGGLLFGAGGAALGEGLGRLVSRFKKTPTAANNTPELLGLPAPKGSVIEGYPTGYPLRNTEPLQLGAPQKPLMLKEGVISQPPTRPIELGDSPIGKFRLSTNMKVPASTRSDLLELGVDPNIKIQATNIKQFTPRDGLKSKVQNYQNQINQYNNPNKLPPPNYNIEKPFQAYPGEVANVNTPPKVASEFSRELFPKLPTKDIKNLKVKMTPAQKKAFDKGVERYQQNIKKNMNENMPQQNTNSIGTDLSGVDKSVNVNSRSVYKNPLESNVKQSQPIQGKSNETIGRNPANNEIPSMNPDDFSAIRTVDDLPDDISALKSFMKESQRRTDTNSYGDDLKLLKINLQLFAEAQKKLTRFENNMQRFSDIEELVNSSDNWKDKGAASYSRETWDRNPVDVAGIVEGTKVKKAIIEPIRQNEAVSTRMKNEYRKTISDIKLTPKESELTQQLGEGKITLNDLKQVPDVNYAKVENAVNTFRQVYNDLFTKANESLTRNGYDPVPYRKDYFPHFDGKDSFLKQLGIDIKADNLPTDIAGLTADFRPGKNWFGNFLQRKSDLTTFDAIQGFDRYVEGISRVINHTDDIQRLRTFTQALRNKHEGTDHLSNMVANLEEFTNTLAGKKSIGDRGFESTFGRKVYQVIDAAKRRVGANMVALNPASWITNTIPLINTAAENNKVAVAKALNETVKNIIKDDGFINQSTFLTNRVGSDPLFLTGIQKATQKLTTPFRAIDQFTSQVVTRAKYHDAISKGVPEVEALKIADDWAAKTMGDRSFGSQPTLFNQRNPLTSVFTQFQLEVNNQISHVFKDMPREFSGGKLASVGAQLLFYSYLYNQLFKKITGNEPALDPVGFFKNTIDDITNKNLPASQKALKITQRTARQVPFLSSLVGGGRIPLSAAIPDPTKFTSPKNVAKELIKPVTYLVPPVGGGQIKKTYDGLSAVSDGGVYSTDSNGKKKLLYRIPKTPYNYLKAGIFGKSSLKETKDYYDKGKR